MLKDETYGHSLTALLRKFHEGNKDGQEQAVTEWLGLQYSSIPWWEPAVQRLWCS